MFCKVQAFYGNDTNIKRLNITSMESLILLDFSNSQLEYLECAKSGPLKYLYVEKTKLK